MVRCAILFRTTLLLAALVFHAAVSPAAASPSHDPSDPSSQSSKDERIADAIIRAFEWRIAEIASVEDAQSAVEDAHLHLLRILTEYLPRSENLHRRLADLALAAGLVDDEVASRRALLHLAPGDRRNQALLLIATVRLKQDVGSRLGLVTEYLSADSLKDSSIRSALASFAADSAWSAGLVQQAVLFQDLAVSLDSANRRAAWLPIRFAQSPASFESRLTDLITACRADPSNPDGLVLLSTLLARNRYVVEAAEAMDTATAVLAGLNLAVPSQHAVDRVLLEAARGDAVSLESALSMARVLQARLESPEVLTDPDAARVLSGVLRARATIADGAGREEDESEAWSALRSIEDRFRLVPDGFVALWLDRDTGDNVADAPEDPDPAYQSLDLLRRGLSDEAAEALTGADESLIRTAIARAIVEESRGNRKSAASILLRAWESHPACVESIWCKIQLERLLGQPVPAPQLARTGSETVSVLLDDIWSLHADIRRWVALEVSLPAGTVYQDRPTPIRVTWRHQGRWPLAFGPTDTIRTDLAVWATAIPKGIGPRTPLGGFMVDAHRSLSMKPGEVVSTVIDVPFDQMLVDSSATDQVHQLEIVVCSAPQVQPEGTFLPGHLGLAVPASRFPVAPRSSGQGTDWRALGRRLRAGVVSAEDRTCLRQSVDSWPALTDVQRAEIVLMLPSVAGTPDEDLDALSALARRSTDTWTSLAWIVTRAVDSDDPLLLASIREGGPDLRAFATAMRQALAESEAAAPASTITEP